MSIRVFWVFLSLMTTIMTIPQEAWPCAFCRVKNAGPPMASGPTAPPANVASNGGFGGGAVVRGPASTGPKFSDEYFKSVGQEEEAPAQRTRENFEVSPSEIY